jgi:hypothetical protein
MTALAAVNLPACLRDQESFSAGPHSFNSSALWFRRPCRQSPASNPFLTHGTVPTFYPLIPLRCLNFCKNRNAEPRLDCANGFS